MNIEEIEKRSCNNCTCLSRSNNCIYHHCKIENPHKQNCNHHEYNFKTVIVRPEYLNSIHNLLTEMCESFKNLFEWEDSRSYANPYLDYGELRKTLEKAQQYLQDTKENS